MPPPLPLHRTPWGNWRVLARGNGFQVKRLEVSPRQRFSLQFHHRRSEHWVVVAGIGRVVLGTRTLRAWPGRALFIPKRATHRLQNVGSTPLVVIEVQRGDYLGEDDIVRLADDYARSCKPSKPPGRLTGRTRRRP